MAVSGSFRIVVAALVCSAVMATAKVLAAAYTGSATLLASALQSIVETSAQAFLLYGVFSLQRQHEDRALRAVGGGAASRSAASLYFWSFVVGLILYALASGVVMHQGVGRLLAPQAVAFPEVHYAVLGGGLMLGAVAMRLAWERLRALRPAAAAEARSQALREPVAFAVFTQAGATLAGTVAALAATAFADFGAATIADGMGALVIVMILASVAALFGIALRALVMGEATPPGLDASVSDFLRRETQRSSAVRRVRGVSLSHGGPDRIVVMADLEFHNGVPATQITRVLTDLGARLRAQHPTVVQLCLASPHIDGAVS